MFRPLYAHHQETEFY